MAKGRKSLPKGVEYLGGSARKYRITNADGTHVEMSRRQYEKIFEHKPSFEKRTKANRERGAYKPMTRYNAIVRDFIKTHEAQTGTRLSKGAARNSPELKALIRDLKTKSRKPTGRKAQALVALGRRAPEWQNIVGESL